MPSSYTTNLGIELPSDGELDGVWGDVVNTNMDILDRAINGGVTLTLSGTSSTLTTTDGTLSDGQNKFLILGGTPSATHTITIAPNDAEKLYYVYNLSGQSVVFTQGSGTTVTVATGDTAVIYADGGGAGAGVVNIVDHFAMNSVRITGGAITGATISGITDIAIADGGTGASTAPQALINLGLTASAAEINILDGVTASTAEINILDGVTASTAEINILDGVTASAAEINILDGVTATAVEINILDGATLSTTELNYVDGVTSSIQTQLDSKAPLASPTFTGTPAAPTAAGGTNTTQLATTAFVNSEVGTANSSLVKTALNASGSAPIYACRAWVNFDGTASPPTIRASGNVTSITDLGPGYYTVNMTTAISDANYSAVATAGDAALSRLAAQVSNFTASSFQIYVINHGNAFYQDATWVAASVFR